MLDEILQKIGWKYEELTSAERETLYSWIEALETNQLTIDKIRDYLGLMRDSVETELTKAGNDSKHDLFLKARLRNYMLLLAFLSSPEKAKKAVDNAIAGLRPKRG